MRSGLYALLEGAATHLEISRDDIDGTVHTGADGMPSLLAFRIGEYLEPVVEDALARVGGCECGPARCPGGQKHELNGRQALALRPPLVVGTE
ncbi:DUF1998 domain-containing protein [Streptomyces sp. NPDC017890]|uniref:DUF1998 domain-containing protein n=1 Tax=Streptomyces sp. NPDC017890 TaxID=3365015 RepID=UPI0037A43E11